MNTKYQYMIKALSRIRSGRINEEPNSKMKRNLVKIENILHRINYIKISYLNINNNLNVYSNTSESTAYILLCCHNNTSNNKIDIVYYYWPLVIEIAKVDFLSVGMQSLLYTTLF